MWEILCGIMSIPHNIVMDLNNVMKVFYIPNFHGQDSDMPPLSTISQNILVEYAFVHGV
jgi:hypothetical protein